MAAIFKQGATASFRTGFKSSGLSARQAENPCGTACFPGMAAGLNQTKDWVLALGALAAFPDGFQRGSMGVDPYGTDPRPLFLGRHDG